MSVASDEFEKQIKRIHDVLLQDTAIVTWNDKIPDPDNPKQSRQIDITIKKDGEITHIECREHKDPQNTKWIEELYGRKISLQATAMIGVSSSGFTEGAIKKAKRLGIFVCNLEGLTREEIKSWGDKTRITWYYYIFSDLEICYFLESIKGFDPIEVEKHLISKPEYNTQLFNQIKYQFNQEHDFVFPYGFRFGKIYCQNVSILGRNVIGISLRGSVNRIAYNYLCPIVKHFHQQHSQPAIIASVEKTKDQNIEIIKSKSGFSSVDIDLSIAPQAPPNSVLAGIFEFYKLPGSKKYPPKFRIIGSQEQEVLINNVQYVIAEIKE